MTLGTQEPRSVRARMRAEGVALRLPPVTVRVRSPLPFFADQLCALYADCDELDARDYADIDMRVEPVHGLRGVVRRQVQVVVDGITPFEPFPISHALPMFEWGLNWVFSHRMHQYLLLHSAAVERDGAAVLLPAWPGSGKSTLAVSLMCRGWRFLSDEFGVVSLGDARVLPFVRPAALKNASIDVMQAFTPSPFIGPIFPKTRKGDVAHVRPQTASVRRADESAEVAAIVFPDFRPDETLAVLPLEPATAFLKLAGNAFNYEVIGERAFRAVAAIIRRSKAFIVRYGDLAQAHGAIDDIVRGARA